MLNWFGKFKYRTYLVITLGLGILCFLFLTGTVSSYMGRPSAPEKVVDRLETSLRNQPYQPALLLESARYHYKTVRKKLQKGSTSSEIRPLIRDGLRQYRRLVANPDWSLDRRDYFYAAYLYFQLGRPYYGRAKSLALKSYQKGFRSRSLITLLANIEYHQSNSKEDFKIALNYYESLGPGLRDPVLLYNKAQTLRQLEKFDRASEVLERGEKFLDAYPRGERLLSKYRLAKVQLKVQQGQFGQALTMIRTIPQQKRSLKLRTLYARCLIEIGQIDRARTTLKELVKHPRSPREAQILLNDITNKSKQTRS